MSLMRRRRLARLEARQPAEGPWQDPYPVARALWAAIGAKDAAGKAQEAARKAGRPFSELPSDPPTPESEWSPAKREAMRYVDGIARRLAQEAAQEGR